MFLGVAFRYGVIPGRINWRMNQRTALPMLIDDVLADGLRIVFQEGRIIGVEPWQPAHSHDGDASFPGLSFYQLLLGYRSLDDIEYALADCRVRGDGPRALLNALFPRQQSLALGIV